MPKQRGNGQGSVSRIGVSNWRCIVTVAYEDGKAIRVSKTGFGTKNEAIAWGYAQKEKANPKVATFSTLWNDFLDSGYNNLSSSQQGKLELAYKRIKGIHNKPIDSVHIKELQKLVSAQDTYYQKREIKVLLSHLYKLAVAQEYVKTNLATYLELPKLVQKERQAFTIEEVAELWNSYESGNWFVGYILLLIYTGMMPQELFDCTTDMVDLENGIIFGCGAKTEKRKSTPIRVANDIKPVLEMLLNREKVIETNRLCPYDKCSFYDRYNACLDMIPNVRHLPPYSCRHTTATLLANLGINPNIIREVMRHSNFQTTTRYIHFDNEPIQDALNKIKVK